MCGGTNPRLWNQVTQQGLSPRVRGNRLRDELVVHVERSIPACAGEPTPVTTEHTPGPVYPRVCGGTVMLLQIRPFRVGLSPRVRGNLRVYVGSRRIDGSIPACAGEPSNLRCMLMLFTVYPRVCGGTRRYGRRPNCVTGLSPRVRGNPINQPRSPPTNRSIPACAGEPYCQLLDDAGSAVYPRVCGGTNAHHHS